MAKDGPDEMHIQIHVRNMLSERSVEVEGMLVYILGQIQFESELR